MDEELYKAWCDVKANCRIYDPTPLDKFEEILNKKLAQKNKQINYLTEKVEILLG